MEYTAFGEKLYPGDTGRILRDDVLTSFRGEQFTYVGTYHPRKVTVRTFGGNLRDFYANVFGLGIFCDTTNEWTFTPPAPKTDTSDV